PAGGYAGVVTGRRGQRCRARGQAAGLGDAWDRLADAVLISGRTDATIQARCASGEIGPHEHRSDRERAQGTGHASFVPRSAPRPAHSAHDGTSWNPDVVRPRWPASAVAHVRQPEGRIAEREGQDATYRRVVGTRRGKGGAAVADRLEERAGADAAP